MIEFSNREINRREINTYMDRVLHSSNKYFFISYSQKDSREEVYPILAALKNSGMNFWFDVALLVGDIWNEICRERIESPSCVGIVLFLSKNSIKSIAVQKELEIANQAKKANNKFVILPILIGFNSVNDIVIELYKNYTIDEAKRLANIVEELLVSEDRIYQAGTLQEKFDSIILVAQKYNAFENVVLDTEKSFSQLSLSRVPGIYLENGYCFYRAGYYPEKTRDNQLLWRLVSVEENSYIFIGENCISFSTYDKIDKIVYEIQKQFKEIAFVPPKSVSLVDFDFWKKYKHIIGRNIPTDYADSLRTQYIRFFWIKHQDTYEVVNSENVMFQKKIKFDELTGGIRLKLTIDTSQI